MAVQSNVAECCRPDTPLASLSKVSRRRPTTDRHGRFVTPRWLTLIPRCDRPVVGPSAFPHAPPRAGANDYFDERPGPVLRDLGNGTGDSTRPPSPQEASRRGPESRAALIPCRTAREGNNGGPIRLSIGRKVAGDPILRECCRADTPLASSRSVSRGRPTGKCPFEPTQ